MITRVSVFNQRREKGFCLCDSCVDEELHATRIWDKLRKEREFDCDHEWYFAGKCMRCGEPKRND